jgi:peptide methionine sulfoxide reductase msrA/msrB
MKIVLGLILAIVLAGCRRSEAPTVAPPSETPMAAAPRAPAASSDVAADDVAAGNVALLAGGCFWGMEDLLRKLPGVLETSVGYTGGELERPTYEDVHTGRSGHAESVRVVFDPKVLSYERLLAYFFSIHDPTTPNRQGNDVGTQYRSAIFVINAEQRRTAEAMIERVKASGDWKAPVATQVIEANQFYPAEDYHQDYLQKNPGGYTCHYPRQVSYY